MLWLCVVLFGVALGAPAQTGSQPVLATFKGGEVSQLDLEAAALVRSTDKMELTAAQAADNAVQTSASRQELVEWVAYTKILAKWPQAGQVPPSQKLALKFRGAREKLLYKIYYLETLAPIVAGEQEKWNKQLQSVVEQHRQEFRTPEKYWFRFIFAGDPKAPPADFSPYEGRIAQARKELEAGAPFEEVARKYSASLPESERGKLLGPVSADELTSERLQVLRKLHPGELSEAFRTQKGLMIVRLEQSVPEGMVSGEQAAAELTKRGLVRKFMREEVVLSHTKELFERYPLKTYPERFSRAKDKGSEVVADSALVQVRNADVFTPHFEQTQPEGSFLAKEVQAAVTQVARYAVIARLAKEQLLGRDARYQRALELIDMDERAQSLLEREASSQGHIALLKDGLRSPAECKESVLRVFNFQAAR